MVYKRYPYIHRYYYYPAAKPPQEKSTNQENKLPKDIPETLEDVTGAKNLLGEKQPHNMKSAENTKSTENMKLAGNIKSIAEEIPMPNEKEDGKIPEASSAPGVRTSTVRYKYSNFPLAKSILNKINFEDILILALILILMHEEKKDDMLIIALVYLLL